VAMSSPAEEAAAGGCPSSLKRQAAGQGVPGKIVLRPG
jgi:hypothetical protein